MIEKGPITPPRGRLKITENHDAYARNLLAGGKKTSVEVLPDGTTKTHVVTALDLTTIPPDATDEQLTEWAANVLELSGQEKKSLLENGTTDESKIFFSRIDNAYHDAIRHCREVLYFTFDEDTFGIKKIECLADIHKMMRGTHAFRDTKKPTALSHERSQAFCTAVSHTVGAFELQKKGIRDFVAASKYVMDTLYAPLESLNAPPTFIALQGKGKLNHLMILDAYAIPYNPKSLAKGTLSVELVARGKDPSREHSKMMRDPERRESEARKDAIGLRLIVDQEGGLSSVVQLLGRLFSEPFRGEKNLQVENEGFFSMNDEADLRAVFEKEFGRNVAFRGYQKKSSSGGFTSLRILGKIWVKEAENTEPVQRNIEVQIVPTNASNETGAREHAVYEMVQKIEEVTRTSYVSIPQFKRFMQDVISSFAEKGQKIEEKDVIYWIMNRVAFVSGKGKNVVHPVHTGVTKRLAQFPGLVNQEWIDAVLHAAHRDQKAVLMKSLRALQESIKNPNGSTGR